MGVALENESVDNIVKENEKLKEEIKRLKEELYALEESPYLPKSVSEITFQVVLDREEIVKNELGKRINEKHSSMYDIKNQVKRYTKIVGIDADEMRMAVTEGLQNIIEHGEGKYIEFMFTLKKEVENPYVMVSFKHYGDRFPIYSLAEANQNALKGDVTSEFFDFEDPRGRGEFLMKELVDERKIINGVEVLPDGTKRYFFKRILIKYKDPNGPRPFHKYNDIKEYLNTLGPEEIICSFHVDHRNNKPVRITVVTHKNMIDKVKELMEELGYEYEGIDEYYYRAAFIGFKIKDENISVDKLKDTFKKVKAMIYEERDSKQ